MKRTIELDESDIIEIIAKTLCVCRTDIKIIIQDQTIKAVITEDPANWQD